MLRVLLVGFAVVALALAAVSATHASNGGDDGTDNCGPYTTFDVTPPGLYQQFIYEMGDYNSISENIRVASYNFNGGASNDFTGAWDVIGSNDNLEWLQGGVGIGNTFGETPYLYVEVHGGTVPGYGYEAEHHFILGSASTGVTYTVTVHGQNNQYYVNAGPYRFPTSGYITYSESLIGSNGDEQFGDEEITHVKTGGGFTTCPWAEFVSTNMNDLGTLGDHYLYPPDQTCWVQRSHTQTSSDVWGIDCEFQTPPCQMPGLGAPLEPSPVVTPLPASGWTGTGG